MESPGSVRRSKHLPLLASFCRAPGFTALASKTSLNVHKAGAVNTRITNATTAYEPVPFNEQATFLVKSSGLLPHILFCLLGFGGIVYVYRVSCVP